MWGANTFPMRKQLPNPYFQNPQTSVFLVFLAFSSNKCWWQLRSFSPSKINALAYLFWPFCTPAKGQVAIVGDSTGDLYESQAIQQCGIFFYHDFFFIYVPFFFLSFVCPYLYITFSRLSCLVCVCLSITFIVRNIFSTHTWHLNLAHMLRYQALYPGLCEP